MLGRDGQVPDRGHPERQGRAAPYLLGDRLSVLDLYVATASRWSPGRRSFYSVAPGLADAVRRTDAEPALAALWAERFPLFGGVGALTTQCGCGAALPFRGNGVTGRASALASGFSHVHAPAVFR